MLGKWQKEVLMIATLNDEGVNHNCAMAGRTDIEQSLVMRKRYQMIKFLFLPRSIKKAQALRYKTK